ncbi:MAG: DUF3073 domain-containing protein [Actinobacteria bacterium]|jgi:hypothetical protein|nr:DUF3073 domain-containing protein [Actinomycetota bacterium]
MGRGRAKAKQTKVARALKYAGPETDFERLQRELATSKGELPEGGAYADEDDDVDGDEDDEALDDPYAKYYEGDDEEEQQHSA